MQAIREIEHVTMRAWPALETTAYDGWLLRFSRGYTGRANSVNPFDQSTLPLAEKIAFCEAEYARRGLNTRYRLNEAVQPAGLDAELEARGYTYYSETFVQTCDLDANPVRTDERFHYTTALSDAWLEAYASMNGTPPQHVPIAHAMLQRIAAEPCFGWIDDVAVGLAVREGEYVGFFDIVVAPDLRGKGLGRALVSSLMSWGASGGAVTGYLQVIPSNSTALTLYASLGFRHHHHYWYRFKERTE